MIQKMFDSTRSGMTRSSSHMASIDGNDFLELVCENGEVFVRGGSSNGSKKSNEERILHGLQDGSGITKRTRFNTLYSLEDHFPHLRDSDMCSSHQSNGQDSCQSSQSKNSFKFNEEFSDMLRPVTTGIGHIQPCLPSSPLKKQRTDSTQTPSTTNQRTTKVNFSNFSIPAVFLKSATYQGNSATQQTKEESKVEKVAVESGKESNGFQRKTSLTVERSAKPLPQVDEQSEAVRIHRSQGQPCDQTPSSEALTAKEKGCSNTNMCHEPYLASSSVCSLGASNTPNISFKKHEDTDDSIYFSDNDEEPEDTVRRYMEGSRLKRSRNPEVHNLSEKKRREKINKKMRTLKELIPNCNKVDKASMLDDAIDYLKTLKLQLQIMSMSSGLWPLMMLPGAHHMNNGPHLPQLMGGGMGFRPPQLPIPPLSAITDNRLQLFGFPNPMPMHHAPFFPIIANPATQSHLPNSLPNNLDPHENIIPTKQVPESCLHSTPHH
ncbi:hypothetical protein Fmac_006829 [Flemingia macrophylla]|uniref:BHLH domain-containing protein n=1 Tax=Flemingia macrophylla TaxID=520843 RepID=A0ABD1NBS0_9FABA